MEIITTHTPAIEAGLALSLLLDEHQDKSILLMLSGGSAFSLLPYVDTTKLNSRVTITTLDERFSADPTINNFLQLEQTLFYQTALNRGANSISTKINETDTLTKAEKRFEKQLKDWRDKNPEGVIIATLGIGEDGHTAGILPGELGINFDGDSLVVGYTTRPETNPYKERITVTYSFLRSEVAEAIVYAVGEKKRRIIDELKAGSSDFTAPAKIIRSMQSVKLFTDQPLAD